MLARLLSHTDRQAASGVRQALHRSARLSRHFLSIIGLLVVISVLSLWLLPRWRETFALRLASWSSAVMQTQLAIGMDEPVQTFLQGKKISGHSRKNQGAGRHDALDNMLGQPARLYHPLDADNFPSFASLARRIPADRIVAEARDDRVLTSSYEQKLVAQYLAHRYHVAQKPIEHLTRVAFDTGHEVGLDPLLLLAVMAIESSFNPFAESSVGAQGLMQVMSTVHSDKFGVFGGKAVALDPFANVKVGAIVLRDCIVRGGSLSEGLRRYVGASAARNDGGYGLRVLAERERLRRVVVSRSFNTRAKLVARSSIRTRTKKHR